MAASDYTPQQFKEDLLNYTGKNIWNAVLTIQLGELVEHGVFDWSNKLLDWSEAKYDDTQYQRVCKYFIERFRFREISIEPFYEWATRLRYTLVYELMPKYKPLYKAVENGIDPLQISDDYEKRRTIGSDYPETLLSGNSDYISNGTDVEYEHVKDGDPAEQIVKWAENMKSIDQMLCDELEKFFISIYTVNANVF